MNPNEVSGSWLAVGIFSVFDGEHLENLNMTMNHIADNAVITNAKTP